MASAAQLANCNLLDDYSRKQAVALNAWAQTKNAIAYLKSWHINILIIS